MKTSQLLSALIYICPSGWGVQYPVSVCAIRCVFFWRGVEGILSCDHGSHGCLDIVCRGLVTVISSGTAPGGHLSFFLQPPISPGLSQPQEGHLKKNRHPGKTCPGRSTGKKKKAHLTSGASKLSVFSMSITDIYSYTVLL